MKIVLKSEPNDCEGSVNRLMQLLQLQHTRPGCMINLDFNQRPLFWLHISHDVDFRQKLLVRLYLRIHDVDFDQKFISSDRSSCTDDGL